MHSGPTPSVIQPRGKIELSSPVMMEMTMPGAPASKDGEQAPILQAKLGEMLELRWELMALDTEMDFFVKVNPHSSLYILFAN